MGTFRDKNGLWTQVNIEDVATPEAFARDPGKVMAFYNARRGNCITATPNAAHFALAELQASEHEVTLVTQNIDDLHDRVNTDQLLHLHGELLMSFCMGCGFRQEQTTDLTADMPCPSCHSMARCNSA